jgi:hypothetical protein
MDSCFRRNVNHHPINENVIPVKTGTQRGLSLKGSIPKSVMEEKSDKRKKTLEV